MDFGCRKAILSCSAPGLGALSINLIPFESHSASAFATPSWIQNAT